MIGVVIVSYNPDRSLVDLVRVLSKQLPVVVVDNNSSGFSKKYLEECRHTAQNVLELSENFGIAKALNLGFSYLLASGCDWVLSLDQDSLLPESYADNALKLVKTVSDDVAMICPEVFETDSHRRYQGCDLSDQCEIEMAITSGSISRICDIFKIGGFTEEFFIDYVDFDVCLRLRAAGKKIIISKALTMRHKIGSPINFNAGIIKFSSLNHTPIRRYYKHRNFISLVRRNQNINKRWFIRQSLAHFLEIPKILLVESDKKYKISMIFKGTYAGLCNVSGKLAEDISKRPRNSSGRLKISVCMATYQGDNYIVRQVLSILPQLLENDELIIQDDCSKDSTVELIRSFDDTRIKISVNEKNLGVIPTFERALSRASGDIVFLADQDDEWLENKIAIMSQVFVEQPDVAVVVGDAIVIDQEGQIISPSYFRELGSASGILKNLHKNSYVGCCMAVRREVLNLALPIPITPRSHDAWLGLIAETMGKSIFLEQSTIMYRRHATNASQMSRSPIADILKRRSSLALSFIHRLISKGGIRA